MDIAAFIDRADVDEMGEQRSGGIELLAIHNEGSAVVPHRCFEGADVLAPGLGKGIAEAIALQRATEPQELLLFACRDSDGVQGRQMVLRQLAQAWVGCGNDRDDLSQRSEGYARSA